MHEHEKTDKKLVQHSSDKASTSPHVFSSLFFPLKVESFTLENKIAVEMCDILMNKQFTFTENLLMCSLSNNPCEEYPVIITSFYVYIPA